MTSVSGPEFRVRFLHLFAPAPSQLCLSSLLLPFFLKQASVKKSNFAHFLQNKTREQKRCP
jgi:hypothetical protein